MEQLKSCSANICGRIDDTPDAKAKIEDCFVRRIKKIRTSTPGPESLRNRSDTGMN
jgi:hypothetical protein